MNEYSPLPPILGQRKSQIGPTTNTGFHVLTLTPFFPTQEDEAAGCFISEPLDALTHLGIKNTVFAVQSIYYRRVRARPENARAQWFRYFCLPGGIGLPTAGAFVFSRIISGARELHQSDRIDLIHAHSALPCGHAAMLLSSELGVPYIVSVHGLDAFSTRQVSGRAGEWCRRISQRVYGSSRRVLCISEHVREQVLEGAGRSCRTSVVYNSVDAEMFSAGDEPVPDEPRILSVGDLIPTKGHDVLLQAVASLLSEFPSLKVEIIGEGPELPRLVSLANQLRIAERVNFSRRRSRQGIAAAMKNCTIFALPSGYEALGCVYLEAMSVGKPTIGCRGQGIAEIIQHGTNGLLVGTDNAKELGLAIAMLLRDDALRRRISVAARDTILDRFTLAQQARNLARVYREAVA